MAEVEAQLGSPDILVNNAAVTFLRPLDEFPEKRACLMIEMHVLAPLHLTQLAIPAMRERRQGWVLMLTSLAGDRIEGPPFSDFDRVETNSVRLDSSMLDGARDHRSLPMMIPLLRRPAR